MVYAFVRRALSEITGEEENRFRPTSQLSGPEGLSTVQLAQLFIQCERAMSITIHDEDALDLHEMQDLVDYVEAQMEDGREDYRAPSDEGRQGWYYE